MRRHFDNITAILRHATGILLLCLALPAHSESFPIQDLEQVRAEVETFLRAEAESRYEGDIQISVGNLDNRLRVKACQGPLLTELSPGSDPLGKTTAMVKCSEEGSWTLYVPGYVKILGEVLVATRYLPKGTKLQPSDGALEKRDISQLPYGHITDAQDLAGMVATRSIRATHVITPNALKEAPLVRRDDKVTLLATNGTLEVRAFGVALEDGTRGQRIQVRNSSSKRIVEGVVISPGVVRIEF